MRSSGNSSVPPIPIPEPKPNPIRDLAHRLAPYPTPEAEARLAAAVAEVHDILAGLNALAARVERLRAQGRRRIPDRNLPQDIPQCAPGDSFNMPGDLGGEYFETDPEAFFWTELGLQEAREALADVAASLARDLEDANPAHAPGRAEELLARLPASMLDALRARLVELEAGS